VKLFAILALGFSVLGAAAAAPKTVVCPVMGNKITVTAATLKSVYKGQTYYLCCNSCKAKFEKDPAKYAAVAAKAAPKAGVTASCKDGKCVGCPDGKCTCCKDGKCACGADCKCECCKDGKCAGGACAGANGSCGQNGACPKK
jgi:YHS domain-containing protein